MRINRIRIENFRSVKELDLELGDTTVLIGQNNAGKSAVLDALRIVLTRRWGQRGTGFTGDDVHCPDQQGDPKTLPPIKIEILIEEPRAGSWDADMVAALENITGVLADGRNCVRLRTTCAWSVEKEAFEPAWEFLDAAGVPMGGRSQRATNLTEFFTYLPLFWLGALRDATTEFAPKAGHWGRLLRSVRIPDELETEALQILAALDARIVAADPLLAQIAELIGRATRIAIGEAPGSARLNTLPLAMDEMLQRTGIVLRNEELRPWLPLGQHGQGLQSLAVIFLFQAAVLQQLSEAEKQGVEAIFAIEEPEAHLHPQAARQLWEHVGQLTGQKLMATHSPYFVQHIPLRDLRLLRLRTGRTECSAIPKYILSELPWNPQLEGFVRGALTSKVFFKDVATNCLAAQSWISAQMARVLERCYRRDPEVASRRTAIQKFRQLCRVLPSAEDESELRFHGRRIRGEIFFARRWILVEGVSEVLLIQALGHAFGWPTDAHGVSVIDFQQSGSAGVYAALATAFGMPWHMLVDGDGQSAIFREQLLDRGFSDAELAGRFLTLPAPNNLEDQLIADGHEQLLRSILYDWRGVVKEALAWLPTAGISAPAQGEAMLSDADEDKAAWETAARAIRAEKGGEPELAELLQGIALRPKEPPPDPSAVTLLTVHGAKGLEFDQVWVIGMAESVLPAWQSLKQDAPKAELEEERRNCFVAITRTRQTLVLTRAKTYHGWAKKASRFISEMRIA